MRRRLELFLMWLSGFVVGALVALLWLRFRNPLDTFANCH